MLNSRTARLVLSLLIAVLLWAYVVGEVNPSKTKTIRNVPITYTYEDTLNERGLAIGGVSDEYINVEISGARAILGDITPTDISATINVASAQKGDNEMSINIRVPSGITVNKQTISRTTVTVESMSQKPVGIEVEYIGDFAPGDQGHTVSISSSQILVSGAETLVDKISAVRGVVDASNLSDHLTAISCQLDAVDELGNVVNGVRLSQKSVSVTAILARTKTVDLTVPITNANSKDYVKETEVPDRIRITGTADVIESIDEVTAESVDIGQLKEDGEIPLSFTLPDGIELAEGEEPVVKVIVSPIVDKEFTFGADEINIEGGRENYGYSLQENLEVQVTANDKQDILDALNKNAITLSVDVSKLDSSGEATISINCSRDVRSISASPESVNVQMRVVTNNTGEETAGSDNNGN